MKKLSFMSNALCLALFIFVCMGGLISCNNNDNNVFEPDEEESEEPVVDDELAPFVGYWEPNYSDLYGDLFLYDDGTCRATHPVDGSYVYLGEWTFDAKTNFFSNSATNKTFLLTLHNENTIIGVDISNEKTVTYKKETIDGYELTPLVYGDWKNADGQLLSCNQNNAIRGDRVPELPQNTSAFKYDEVNIYFTAQDKNTYSYDYEIRWKGKKYYGSPDNKWYDVYFDTKYKGKLTIENPYSPSKCKLIFTGVLEGAYTKIKD